MLSPNSVFVLFCFVSVALLVAITLFYYRQPKAKKAPLGSEKDEVELDARSIIYMLKLPNSTKENLSCLVDHFLREYSRINPTPHQVKEFLKAVCLHRYTNAQMIIRTQEALTSLNPSLKTQLNRIVEIRAGIS